MPDRSTGTTILVQVWVIAVIGKLLPIAWLSAPRWLTVGSSIAMEWVAVPSLPAIASAFGFATVAQVARACGTRFDYPNRPAKSASTALAVSTVARSAVPDASDRRRVVSCIVARTFSVRNREGCAHECWSPLGRWW